MEPIVMPTEQELESLRQQLKDAQRHKEYRELSAELIRTNQLYQTNMVYDGTLQSPDHVKILKSNRHKTHFFEIIFSRIASMCSPRPITGSIIALCLMLIAFYFALYQIDGNGFLKYQPTFLIGIQIASFITILKSATRSLLLPLSALFLGCVTAHHLSAHQTLLHFHKSFYEHLMVIGIVGLIISVITID